MNRVKANSINQNLPFKRVIFILSPILLGLAFQLNIFAHAWGNENDQCLKKNPCKQGWLTLSSFEQKPHEAETEPAEKA